MASFVPMALSYNSEARILNNSLVNVLVGAGAKPSFGEAAAAALADFATKGGQRYIAETYSVIGDPALRVQQ